MFDWAALLLGRASCSRRFETFAIGVIGRAYWWVPGPLPGRRMSALLVAMCSLLEVPNFVGSRSPLCCFLSAVWFVLRERTTPSATDRLVLMLEATVACCFL